MPEFSPKSDKYPSGESSTPSSLCYCHHLVKEEIFLVLKSLGLRDAIYVLLIRNWLCRSGCLFPLIIQSDYIIYII
jgi:hypothetical protein